MKPEFDPYHKWLGIPPSDQPANHYRLLGVELFESDPDVIESAADKHMAFLRTFQSGKNGAISQKLLNEISKARICLIDAQKRAEYDNQLRIEMARAQQQVAASQVSLPPDQLMPPTSVPVHTPAAVHAPPPVAPRQAAPGSVSPAASPVRVRPNKYYPRQRSGNKMFLSVVLAVLSVFILGLIILFAIGLPQSLMKSEKAVNSKLVNPDDQQTNTTSKQQIKNNPDDERETKTKGRQPETKKNVTPEISKQVVDDTKVKSKSGQEEKPPEKDPVMEDSGKDNEKTNDSKTKNGGEETPKIAIPQEALVEPPLDLRIAIPDKDTLRELNEQIEKEFELASASSRREQVELARRMVSKAKTEADDNLRYALYAQALKLSAKADSASTMEMFDEFATQFAVDKVQLRAFLLKLNADNVESKSSVDRLIRESQEFVSAAVAEDRWQEALDVYQRLCELTAQPIGESFNKSMLVKMAELTAQHEQWNAYQQDLEVLKSDPDNGKANASVGAWLCFREHDWQTGLPLLAKSKDEQLKLLAETDLAAVAGLAEQMASAGDAWWDAGEKLPDGLRDVYRQRAAHWYALALDNLPFGSKDQRIAKRLSVVNGDKGENPVTSTDKRPLGNAQSAKLTATETSINCPVRVESFVFVPGQLRLLTATSEGVTAFDLPGGEAAHHVAIDRKKFDPQSLAAYSDGIHFAGKYDKDYVVWNLKTGEIVATLKDSSPAGGAIAFSPNSQSIAGVTARDSLIYWNVDALEVAKEVDLGKSVSPKCLKFSPDGDLLAAASVAKVFTISQSGKIVDMPTEKTLGTPIRDVEFSADGRQLAGCRGDESIFLWSLADSVNYQVMRRQSDQANKGQIKDIVFLPGGKLLASVSDALGDAELCVWNTETGEIVDTLGFDSNTAPNVAVTSDGKYLAAPGAGDSIQIYEIEYK